MQGLHFYDLGLQSARPDMWAAPPSQEVRGARLQLRQGFHFARISCELRSRFKWLPTFVFSFKRCGLAGSSRCLHFISELEDFFETLPWCHSFTFKKLAPLVKHTLGLLVMPWSHFLLSQLSSAAQLWGTSANSFFSLQLCSCVDSIINLISDSKGGSHT